MESVTKHLKDCKKWLDSPESQHLGTRTNPKGGSSPAFNGRSPAKLPSPVSGTPDKASNVSLQGTFVDEDNGAAVFSENTHLEQSPFQGWQTPKKHEDSQDYDIDAPLPAPLHVIECAHYSQNVHHKKPKRSSHVWSVSDLDAADFASDKLQNGERPIPDATRHQVSGEFGIDQAHYEENPPVSESDPWVIRWISEVCDPGTTDILAQWSQNIVHHQCDIDPATGLLLAPIQYPETNVNQEAFSQLGEELRSRQQTWSSNQLVQREIIAREKLVTEIKAREQESRQLQLEPLTPEVRNPSADCLIRPATRKDFSQIAEIINLESQDEDLPQVFDTEAVSAEAVERIYNYCRENYRPFVVAFRAEEDLLDRSKWPLDGEKQYLEYVKFFKAQPPKPKPMVGFAYVVDSRIGFLPTSCPGSRFSGQLKLLVHPKHRRNHYGDALVDRILASVSPYHKSTIDYQWECQDPCKVYESPAASYNRRKYSAMYVEIFCKPKGASKWHSYWLKRLDFKRVAFIEDVAITNHIQDNVSANLEIWEIKFISTKKAGTHQAVDYRRSAH